MFKRLIYDLMFEVFLIFIGILFVGATAVSTDIEEEAELYKMDIHPITPDSGITTGHVIAYGHYIKPPYKVEVKDTIVYVNGVQVWPVLIPEKKKRKPNEAKKSAGEYKRKSREVRRKVKSDPELMALIEKAKEAYRESVKRGEKGMNPVKAAAEVLKSSPRVDDVVMGINDFVVVDFKGMRPSYLISFVPPKKKSPEEIEKRMKQEEEMRRKTWEFFYRIAEKEGYPPNKYGVKLSTAHHEANGLKKLLQKGWGALYEPTHITTFSEDDVVFIIVVLRDPFLSPLEKSVILKSKWYIYNFNSLEWPTIKEVKLWKNGDKYLKWAEEYLKVRKKEAKEYIKRLERAKEGGKK